MLDLKNVEITELPGFSDASLKAYAAIIYIRFKFKDGLYFVNFVASKTKINPIERKTLTMVQVGYFAQGCRTLQIFPQEVHT